MTRSAAETVEEYIEALSDDRRAMFAELREPILENLPEGYRESMTPPEALIRRYESVRRR